MKFLAGWIAGIATAWAALAIWRRFPPFPDIDAEPEDVWEPRRGDRRPGYDDSVARGGWTMPSDGVPFDPIPEVDIRR
uniref:Minor tail protein n=1 Tax=Microbacterium phage Crisis TaxID=3158889 RepID=A0AAU8GNJ0_9CAUD